MGCKRLTDIRFGGGEPCTLNTPETADLGVTFEFLEYPSDPAKTNIDPLTGETVDYHIPERDLNSVMHDSVIIELPDPGPLRPGPSNCGKVTRDIPNNYPSLSNQEPARVFYDYYPNELSYDMVTSDTWFSYLYDTSDNMGIVGTPCYHIEDEDGTTVSTPPGGGSPSSSSSYEYTCVPCNNFTCSPAETTLKYTAPQDLTGDPDCPHPTLFGFGTTSYKLAFKYDALATTQPTGVQDIQISYTGSGYVDAWDQGSSQGITYESSQNPWQATEESFGTIQIFSISLSGGTGLKLQVKIEPKFDDSGTSTVFSGTEWTILNIMDPGTGYTLNDTTQLSYAHTHPDNSTTTLSVNIKLSAVGDVEIVNPQSGFDRLVEGDTLNGHKILRAFHTDINNFPYHVVYLDGAGSDFTKETQYTSSRSHQITAKAGYGIKDRAILIGIYEFLDKSVQFVTARLTKGAPDLFNTLKQPNCNVTVTNGVVTGVSITDGGEGWNQLTQEPILEITAPKIPKRSVGSIYQAGELVDGEEEPAKKNASVKGIFTSGVLTGVQILDGGKGYPDDYPPQIWVRNVFKENPKALGVSAYDANTPNIKRGILKAYAEEGLTISRETYAHWDNYNDNLKASVTAKSIDAAYYIDKDPTIDRYHEIGQRKYTKDVIDNLRQFHDNDRNKGYVDKEGLKDLSDEYRNMLKNHVEDIDKHWNGVLDKYTQEKVPEKVKYDANYVQTIQGSLTQLPYATENTKYLLKQYRADPTQHDTITIELSCKPTNAGCAHINCNAPAGTTPNPNTQTSTDGDGNTVVTTLTYTMSNMLGDGCKEWTAKGDCKIYHDLTRSMETFDRAVKAYGNPYS